MITVTLSKKEILQIMECVKHSENKELYNKFWRIMFNKGEKLNGFS